MLDLNVVIALLERAAETGGDKLTKIFPSCGDACSKYPAKVAEGIKFIMALAFAGAYPSFYFEIKEELMAKVGTGTG